MEKKVKSSINVQILIIALLGVIIIGAFTYVAEYALSDRTIKNQLELMAFNVAQDVGSAVREYPAYRLLLRYWYHNADSLDIEYDVDFRDGILTKQKVDLLTQHLGPDYNIRYITNEEFRTFSEEDKKLYAEIVYSWLLTRLNSVKKIYGIDYLFCVITDTAAGAEPFQNQFFLFSAGSQDMKRSKNYEDIYVLGTEVSVADNIAQQTVMKNAILNNNNTVGSLATAKNYMDYYDFLDFMDDKVVLIGLTYNLGNILKSIHSEAIISTLNSMFFELGLLVFVMLFIFFYVIKPLKLVISGINTYKELKDSSNIKQSITKNLSGNFSYFIRRNEIGLLSSDVIALAEEMDNYVKEIELISAEKERISLELSLASNIQNQMLPHIFPPFPNRKEFDLYASMTPAKEVGGDFYDYFMLDDDHLVFLIADVSGKGIPAALYMMAAKIIIHNMAIKESSPARILELANREIYLNNPLEMFVTVWLGILELSTGKLVAANAGHEIPIIKHPEAEYALYKDPHGLVAGAIETVKYKDYELFLEPSSTVFVYTDGLAEANNVNKELYGTDRIIKCLNKNKDVDNPEEILKSVQEDVDVFTEGVEQFDDLTMLCLHYNGFQKYK